MSPAALDSLRAPLCRSLGDGDELLLRPALELAELVRRRQVSSTELITRCLNRIAAHNPNLAAFVTVMERSARRAAAVKDRRQTDPASLPPFWGLPMGIKDLNLVRGEFAKMGSRAFTWLWSPVDDVTVSDLRRAGFVMVGKTTTSELALLPVVEPDIHPPTRNPWNDQHSAGGSSGGAAAAVAAGMLPVAHASDGAGSIRIPASFCGLVGHKATRGLLANPYRRVDTLEFSTCGAVTRTVADSAALLDVLLRRRPGEVGSFLAALRAPLPRLRVKVVTTAPVGTTAPEVAAAARSAAAVLAALGHEVSELSPPAVTLEEFLPMFQRLAANAPVFRPGVLQPVTRWLRSEGRRYRHADMLKVRDALSARVLSWGAGADVVLTPTVPVLPPRVGSLHEASPAVMFGRAAVFGAFTAMCNLTGQPAISVPGASAGGLPIGIQLIGRNGGDATLLALAQELMEASRGTGVEREAESVLSVTR